MGNIFLIPHFSLSSPQIGTKKCCSYIMTWYIIQITKSIMKQLDNIFLLSECQTYASSKGFVKSQLPNNIPKTKA